MDIIETELKDVKIIVPKLYTDNRGYFYESWKKSQLDIEFVQENFSISHSKGTIRGLHYQKAPYCQAKLIQCICGKIMDVVIDLRRNSIDYLKWSTFTLSENNRLQLFIPKGFAHGFLTLTNNSIVNYKVDSFYAPNFEQRIKWNDPTIGVDWGIDCPILSNKDALAPYYNEEMAVLC